MGKHGGIKIYVRDEKSGNVYIFNAGLELWEFSRIMPKLVGGTTIWLEVHTEMDNTREWVHRWVILEMGTEMGNTREKKYLGLRERDFSSGHLKLKMQVSYSEGKQGV